MDNTESGIATLLNHALAEASLGALNQKAAEQLATYLAVLMKWNARTNLTAVRDLDSIISRHFVECIACARALPKGLGTLLDFGSGAGFPGIPVAICRPEIAVTLAESQGKKAAFLREVGRTLGVPFMVYAARAESLEKRFDCVVLRAVDDMGRSTKAAMSLVSSSGCLAIMTTKSEWAKLAEMLQVKFIWAEPIPLPNSESRLLVLGHRCFDS